MMDRAVIFAGGNEIQPEELRFPVKPNGDAAQASQTLADVERRHILKVLKNCNGNKTSTAKLLGLARSTLLIKLKCYLRDTAATA